MKWSVFGVNRTSALTLPVVPVVETRRTGCGSVDAWQLFSGLAALNIVLQGRAGMQVRVIQLFS